MSDADLPPVIMVQGPRDEAGTVSGNVAERQMTIRTKQAWQTAQRTAETKPEKSVLCRLIDQVKEAFANGVGSSKESQHAAQDLDAIITRLLSLPGSKVRISDSDVKFVESLIKVMGASEEQTAVDRQQDRGTPDIQGIDPQGIIGKVVRQRRHLRAHAGMLREIAMLHRKGFPRQKAGLIVEAKKALSKGPGATEAAQDAARQLQQLVKQLEWPSGNHHEQKTKKMRESSIEDRVAVNRLIGMMNGPRGTDATASPSALVNQAPASSKSSRPVMKRRGRRIRASLPAAEQRRSQSGRMPSLRKETMPLPSDNTDFGSLQPLSAISAQDREAQTHVAQATVMLENTLSLDGASKLSGFDRLQGYRDTAMADADDDFDDDVNDGDDGSDGNEETGEDN